MTTICSRSGQLNVLHGHEIEPERPQIALEEMRTQLTGALGAARRMTERRPRIVIADDYLPMMKALTRLLSPYCDVVGHAMTATELLKEAISHGPDLVTIDLHLGGANGIETCQQLKAAQPNLKIVMVTAEDDSHIRAAALGAGVSDFIPKYMVHACLLPTILRLCTHSATAVQTPGMS